MTDPASRTRQRRYLARALVGLVAIVLAWTWANARSSPRGADDPSELLRRATASKAGAPAKPTGKVVAARVNSSAGSPVDVRLPELRDGSGKLGYGVHLGRSLKPGETASIKMPGGGAIIIGAPKQGEASPGLPGAPGNAPAR